MVATTVAIVATRANLDTALTLATARAQRNRYLIWLTFAARVEGSNLPVGYHWACGTTANVLRQPADQLFHAHPRTGEKRCLLAHMAASIGGAQIAHQIDDAV